MLKVFKWIGVGLAGVICLVIVAVAVLNVVGRRKAATGGGVTGTPVAVSAADSAMLARGRHLADFMGCQECHGPDLSGRQFPTPSFLVAMAAPNLTPGQSGIGAGYTSADWERAIRHGIGKDGRRLIIMPSEAYTNLDDADVAALIAYLQTLPGVNQSFAARKIGILGGLLLGMGAFPTVSELIAHDSVGKRPVVAPAVTAKYGRYLASFTGCNICHGVDLRGGAPAAGGGPPPGPSLVAFVANNSADAFRNTIRSGRTPAGRELNPEFMPWRSFGKMTDDELEAIRLYIESTYASTMSR